MYLIDTNIWLERLLEQEKSVDVAKFLTVVPVKEMIISDFSFHSIGIIMTKLKKESAFLLFIEDIFENANLSSISIGHNYMSELIDSMKKFDLDFDDAYQYTCAKNYNLDIVSYDKDLYKTDIKILTPKDVINKYS
ncbi:MAG: PIN domain-containing protein [Bacteroidetes bacterium]|nr:MAG: PIN domain-containing protein [Bacteroidota bacterium]